MTTTSNGISHPSISYDRDKYGAPKKVRKGSVIEQIQQLRNSDAYKGKERQGDFFEKTLEKISVGQTIHDIVGKTKSHGGYVSSDDDPFADSVVFSDDTDGDDGGSNITETTSEFDSSSDYNNSGPTTFYDDVLRSPLSSEQGENVVNPVVNPEPDDRKTGPSNPHSDDDVSALHHNLDKLTLKPKEEQVAPTQIPIKSRESKSRTADFPEQRAGKFTVHEDEESHSSVGYQYSEPKEDVRYVGINDMSTEGAKETKECREIICEVSNVCDDKQKVCDEDANQKQPIPVENEAMVEGSSDCKSSFESIVSTNSDKDFTDDEGEQGISLLQSMITRREFPESGNKQGSVNVDTQTNANNREDGKPNTGMSIEEGSVDLENIIDVVATDADKDDTDDEGEQGSSLLQSKINQREFPESGKKLDCIDADTMTNATDREDGNTNTGMGIVEGLVDLKNIIDIVSTGDKDDIDDEGEQGSSLLQSTINQREFPESSKKLDSMNVDPMTSATDREDGNANTGMSIAEGSLDLENTVDKMAKPNLQSADPKIDPEDPSGDQTSISIHDSDSHATKDSMQLQRKKILHPICIAATCIVGLIVVIVGVAVIVPALKQREQNEEPLSNTLVTPSPSGFLRTLSPTAMPAPTSIPVIEEDDLPTLSPSTFIHVGSPSPSPTRIPGTASPTLAPTLEPPIAPTHMPTRVRTSAPTQGASTSQAPSQAPIRERTGSPTQVPTVSPSQTPTQIRTLTPSTLPLTSTPSQAPTWAQNTSLPTVAPTQAWTAAPTTSPLQTLPPQLPAEVQANDDCINAIGPLFAYGSTIEGDLRAATPDDVDQCGDVTTRGPGIWYYVLGTGGEMTAHTCLNGLSDTKISVFKGGGCQQNLECIGGNDDFCGSQSAVSWQSNYRQVYSILVSGPETPFHVGNFTLSVEARTNDECETAAGPLEIGSSGPLILGDTLESSADTIDCNGEINVAPSVWYKIRGIGADVTASACLGGGFFNARISVLLGSCGDLSCVARSPVDDCSITFTSMIDADYYLVIHGTEEDDSGRFGLQLTTAAGSGP